MGEKDTFTFEDQELVKEAKKVWNELHPNPIEMALFGSDWKAKRMYSQEEVFDLFQKYFESQGVGEYQSIDFEEWFEQFKKK